MEVMQTDGRSLSKDNQLFNSTKDYMNSNESFNENALTRNSRVDRNNGENWTLSEQLEPFNPLTKKKKWPFCIQKS